jgi:hypothetical protein
MNTINKLLARFGVKLVSAKDYQENVAKEAWLEREAELMRKLHNQRCLTNYYRKKSNKLSGYVDNAVEEAS